MRSAATGLYGKLPARADFVTMNLPRSFVELWDAWLQAAIMASRDRLGAEWLGCYLTAPVWKFALSPDVSGPVAVAGVLIPSVDAVNRHFPLVVAALVPLRSPLDIAALGSTWFGEGEACALACLDPALNLKALESRLAALAWTADPAPVPPEAAVVSVDESDLGARFSVRPDLAGVALLPSHCVALLDGLLRFRHGHYSVWWTIGSDRVAPCVVITAGLPPPPLFASFLRDPDHKGTAAGHFPGQPPGGDPGPRTHGRAISSFRLFWPGGC